MADALASIGLPVTYIGALGEPELHPVFEQFASRATVLSLTQAARTDALEFSDGKLMLGKHEPLKDINWARLCDRIGRDRLGQIFADSRLIGMVNWSMLTQLGEVWQRLIDEVLPNLPSHPAGPRRIFIDFADPAKRTTENLQHGLSQCSAMQQHTAVTVGLNLSEACQVAEALELDVPADPEPAIESMAKDLRAKLDIDTVVIHPRATAAAAMRNRDTGAIDSAHFAGPFVAEPKISTGAGDHFNAGFAVAQLAGLDCAQCLCVGTATSGYYVRHAQSPSLRELADFCAELPEPQA
jgi:hypothetical protein